MPEQTSSFPCQVSQSLTDVYEMLLQTLRFIIEDLENFGYKGQISEFKPSNKSYLYNFRGLRKPKNPTLEILCSKRINIFGDFAVPGLFKQCILTVDYDLTWRKRIRYLMRTADPAIQDSVTKEMRQFRERTGMDCLKLRTGLRVKR